MNNTDELISGLGDRLRHAQPVQKDPHAAELINRHVAAQPDALYLLTQAVLLQEDALRQAQAKITELEQRLAAATPPPPPPPASSGGFLTGKGVFAGALGRRAPDTPNTSAPAATASPTAFAAPAPQQAPGGSFLKTAAAAAVGVAGGGLLLHGLTSAFSDHDSPAAEVQHVVVHHEGPQDEDEWDDGEW